MPNVTIKIEGMDKLQGQFKKSPDIVKKRISDALKASIFEIQKRTNDSGDSGLFQFKTPRSLRTGYLARSFAFGISFGELYASIGPTADYAEYVYNGVKGGEANLYIDRIARDAEGDINNHFKDAGDLIVEELAE